MKIESKELQDFIHATLTAIKGGLAEHKDFTVDGPVAFSLAVVNTQEKGGGIKIYVTNASGKFKKEQVSKLEFKISPVIVLQKRPKTRSRKKRS